MREAKAQMSIYRVEDTAYVDAFAVPSIFDPKLPFYKEWHDFVFFDPSQQLFVLLNFGVRGNPYDAKRGAGSALLFIADGKGKIFSETKLIQLSQLQFSSFNPEFIADKLAVTYADNVFNVAGEIEKSSFNLAFCGNSPPISSKEIFLEVMRHQHVTAEMVLAAEAITKQWDRWVQVPNLQASGIITFNGKQVPINAKNAFHDHEGGRFDWDSMWGWDDGVVFSTSKETALESISFMFYRYGPSDKLAYGGIFIDPKKGPRKYFDSSTIRKTTRGSFDGDLALLPGITRLLYPDYRPSVPQEITYTMSNKSDKLTVSFVPKAVCSIVNANVDATSEVVFNEIYCQATLNGCIGGTALDAVLPCWFESVRPRKSLNTYGLAP